jgi:two-component system CheB/CheR fusion protein
MSETEDAAFEALLEFLKRSRGLDFTGYKRASLQRRFKRRMDSVGCGSFSDYLDFLEVHPDEYKQLFELLLINVTEFFRDPPAWEHLRSDVLPRLLAAKEPGEPVRVWSGGCASGQEAYTAAIVFAELMGVEDFRERVKIYATDIDEDALNQARQATYNAREIESLPPELRERYFERADQRLAFRKDLRRTVIFGSNNLVADAPISRLDLLICRNTLMYFNAETQGRILRHFHFALRDGGVLMLGRSEMMVSHRDLFGAENLKQRIFVKQARPTPSARAGLFSGDRAEHPAGLEDDRLSRDAALELGPHPHIIVSRSGRLTFANLPARALFQISRDDLLLPFAELALARSPVELLGPIEQAIRERRRVAVGEATYAPERGDPRRLEINVAPLLSSDNVAIGASVAFEDVTRYAALRTELEGNRRDLDLAYEELQSTIDELETTNEELQSANEELQTTNEELQSTNEELETMNEELETINDELRERTGDLNQVNDFLETILTSLEFGVAVVDAQQRVQVWNRRAEDLWGLRPDEAVDHHFLSLDIGLPSEQLAPALRAVLGGASERETRELEAVNRRGRTILCAATVLPLIGPVPSDGTRVRGAIVLMETAGGSSPVAQRPREAGGAELRAARRPS